MLGWRHFSGLLLVQLIVLAGVIIGTPLDMQIGEMASIIIPFIVIGVSLCSRVLSVPDMRPKEAPRYLAILAGNAILTAATLFFVKSLFLVIALVGISIMILLYLRKNARVLRNR